MLSNDISIGTIGAGNMATALIEGLLATGVAPASLWASDPAADKLQPLATKGVQVTTDNAHLIAAYIRAHWAIESLHWLRDVSMGEDANKTRTGHAPRNLAALHNTVISIHHNTGTTTIAKTLRAAARNPEHAINHLTRENMTLN